MRRSLDYRLDRIEASVSLRIMTAEHKADMEQLRRRNFIRGTKKLSLNIDDPEIRQALIDNCKSKGWEWEAQAIESYTKDNLDA